MRLSKLFSRKLSVSFAIASVLALGLSSAFAYAAQDALPPSVSATPRIVERVDENRLATLAGNTRAEARAEYDRGPVAPSLKMGDLILVLRRDADQQAAFDAFLAAQQDSSSPNYHHWLAPDEIGQRFGPAQGDIDTISRWLQGHGFTVDNVSRDRMSIRFSGTASQVQGAFHTEIHNLQVKGENHIANMSDPSIPEALTPVVVGVKALHNFFPHPMHRVGSAVRKNPQGGWTRISTPAALPSKSVTPAVGLKDIKPLFGTGGGTPTAEEDIAPYDFATIYNVLPLWTAGTPVTGTGQTVAIAGTSNINPADITAFRAAFGLPAYTATNSPKVIVTNVDPGDCPTFTTNCQDDLVENTLDVEWSGAVAPGAQIALVTSSVTSTTTDALFASEQYIVDNVTARVMNVSYGECELGLGTAGNTTYSNLWSTAEVAGIAVFVSSGDSGAASCDDGGDAQTGPPYGAQFGLSVSGFASTPYNTAVGGTDFAWGWVTNGQSTYWSATNNTTTQASALGYIPEFPWNSTCSNPLFVAELNSANKDNYSASQWCDLIGSQQITFGAGESSILSTVDTVGGSGGASNCINGNGQTVASCSQGYPKPSWQTGVTGIPSTNARYIPDLSFFAANGFSGSAYVICVSAAGTCSYNATTEPFGEEVGGTSVASPIMAAVAALINQKVGVPQGNLNTKLYTTAASETYSSCSSENIPLTGSSCVFNDVDTGTIAMPCDVGSTDCPASGETTYSVQSGYPATAGYDPASGLGSLNVSNFVKTFSSAASPLFTLSNELLLFASTQEGTTDTTTQAITVTNSGTSPATISGITISGANASSFTETNTCGSSLGTGASCTVTVTFAPKAGGALAATLNVADDASGTPQTVSLNGTSVFPIVSLNPTSLTFASTAEGTSAATQSITLSNTGTGSLNISGISITGTNASSFSESDNCGPFPSTLAPSGFCNLTITFTPASVGSFTASVSIADNASDSPESVSLAGTGAIPAPGAGLNPTSLTFASTPQGTAAATQSITLSNTGNAALSISSIAITGTNVSSFSQTNTCSTTTPLAPSGFCNITVTFTPAAVGSLTASVSIADNASGSPQTVSLTGTGAEATGATYSLSAAAVTVAPGSSGTSAITATGTGGYTGPISITLSGCTLATSPTGAIDLPTCSITGATVTFASGASTGAGGAVSISTTAATNVVRVGKLNHTSNPWRWAGAGGAALACLLFFGIPARRRNFRSLLGVLIFAGLLSALSGCGGGSSGGGGNAGTTAGAYTFTLTGTDADNVKQTVTINVTVS